MAWVADALVLLGLGVMTIGVVGVQRMPDVYMQLHAASKAVFLGIIAFVAASTATGDPAIIARGLLIAGFLLLTTPVSAHAVARAAHMRTAGASRRAAVDASPEARREDDTGARREGRGRD